MLLSNALLRNARKLELLVLAQLRNQAAKSLGVHNDGLPNQTRMTTVDDQISGVDLHNLVARTSRVEGQRDATVLAVLFAVTVTGEVEFVYTLCVQRDETQSMGDKFVGKDRAVYFDLDQINSDRGNFGLDDSPYRVGEGQIRL